MDARIEHPCNPCKNHRRPGTTQSFNPHHPGTTWFCAFVASLSFRHAVLASARIFSLFALAVLTGTRLAERAWSRRIESDEKPGRVRPVTTSVRVRQLQVSIQLSATRDLP